MSIIPKYLEYAWNMQIGDMQMLAWSDPIEILYKSNFETEICKIPYISFICIPPM